MDPSLMGPPARQMVRDPRSEDRGHPALCPTAASPPSTITHRTRQIRESTPGLEVGRPALLRRRLPLRRRVASGGDWFLSSFAVLVLSIFTTSFYVIAICFFAATWTPCYDSVFYSCYLFCNVYPRCVPTDSRLCSGVRPASQRRVMTPWPNLNSHHMSRPKQPCRARLAHQHQGPATIQ